MKKFGVLLADMFNEEELIYPYHRLREEGEVYLIGDEKDHEYVGKSGGVTMTSDISAKEAKDLDLDGLIIPGGYSPDNMRRSEDMRELTKKLIDDGKPVAAICHGPWMLASVADLKGKDVTSFFSIKDDLINAGANWVDKEVVVSDNIITSRTPDDLPVFMKTFIEKL